MKLIRQKWDGHGWSCRSGEAWLVEPEEPKLAAYAEVAVSIADQSRTTHVTAELVDVGEGIDDADYEGKDVKGKIVLASGALSRGPRARPSGSAAPSASCRRRPTGPRPSTRPTRWRGADSRTRRRTWRA